MGLTPGDQQWGTERALQARWTPRRTARAELKALYPRHSWFLNPEWPQSSLRERQTLAGTCALGWDLECKAGILCIFFPSALRRNLRPLVAAKR